MFEAWRLRRDLARARSEYELGELRAATHILQEASNVVTDDNVGTGWGCAAVGLGQLKGDSAKAPDLDVLQRNCLQWYYSNPHVRGILRCMVKFVVGQGVMITPDAEMEDVADAWQAFCERTGWTWRHKEIVLRTLRDGECFIRFFNATDGLTMRFIDPNRIDDPSGQSTFGIVTEPDDIETPKEYIVLDALTQSEKERIPAEEILHVKIFADSNQKRGRPLLEPVMPLILKYQQWLDDRIILNKVRSAVALVRKVEGTPAQAAAISAQQRRSASGDNRDVQAMLRPGTVITASGGVSYEFLSPNLQASDVKEDGRQILLAVATAVGLPEYMVTGDASNANYASTMVAESPGVREFEDWQAFFGDVFGKIYTRAIKTAIDAGDIPGQETHDVEDAETGIVTPEMCDTPITCNVQFPPLIHRNLWEETQSYAVHNAQGWASDETIAGKLGYNYTEEQERVAAERELQRQPQAAEDQYQTARDEAAGEPGEQEPTA